MPDLETLIVQICNNNPLLTYKPPNVTRKVTDTYLHSTILEVVNSSRVIILGDDIYWCSHSGDSFFSTQLCELIYDNNLSQHASSLIHVKGSILDLVISNLEEKLTNMRVNEANPIPDHHMVHFEVTIHTINNIKCSKSIIVPD